MDKKQEWAQLTQAAYHDAVLGAILKARQILYEAGEPTRSLTVRARQYFREVARDGLGS